MSERDEITVADAYARNAARTEYLVYIDWNDRTHPVMDIRPAGAKTWNRDEHFIPELPAADLTFEVICADGVLDRVQGDEILLIMPQRKEAQS